MFITKQHSELISRLNEISPSGGGDCPEAALEGLKAALEPALQNSIAYLFSDASAKDYHIYDEIVGLIQKKQIKVNFLLTGDCSNKTSSMFLVYEKLSQASGGQVFDMTRENVKEVFIKISTALDSRFLQLKSVDFETGGSNKIAVNVDESFSRLSISLSGQNATLSVTDRTNKPIEMQDSFTSEHIKFSSFEVADNLYNIDTSAASSYSLRVGGFSEQKFEFGFSYVIPSTIDETSIQPFVGGRMILSIFVTNASLIKCLNHAVITAVNKEDNIRQRNYKFNKVNRNIYSSDAIKIPNKMFKILVVGYDSKGNLIEQLITSGVTAVHGSIN